MKHVLCAWRACTIVGREVIASLLVMVALIVACPNFSWALCNYFGKATRLRREILLLQLVWHILWTLGSLRREERPGQFKWVSTPEAAEEMAAFHVGNVGAGLATFPARLNEVPHALAPSDSEETYHARERHSHNVNVMSSAQRWGTSMAHSSLLNTSQIFCMRGKRGVGVVHLGTGAWHSL